MCAPQLRHAVRAVVNRIHDSPFWPLVYSFATGWECRTYSTKKMKFEIPKTEDALWTTLNQYGMVELFEKCQDWERTDGEMEIARHLVNLDVTLDIASRLRQTWIHFLTKKLNLEVTAKLEISKNIQNFKLSTNHCLYWKRNFEEAYKDLKSSKVLARPRRGRSFYKARATPHNYCSTALSPW